MITLSFSDVICEFPHVNQLKSFVRQPIITVPNFSEPIKKHDIVGVEKTPNLKTGYARRITKIKQGVT